jgi:uncharacterized repeat protein (TIGR03803 family)
VNRLTVGRALLVLFVACVATAIALPEKTALTNLVSFDGANGAGPWHMSLVQGTNGKFYGTTIDGGTNAFGTVFEITSRGILTTLHSFEGPEGYRPYAGLLQGADGNFYGSAFFGGSNGYGSVFRITEAGKVTTLYSFCAQTDCADGANPGAALLQATNRNLYGTTTGGGGGAANSGTVFEITPAGELTTLYSFCSQSNCTDGAFPAAGLLQATDGNFYGTTVSGGDYSYGTVFKITKAGKLTTLHSFEYFDGEAPFSGLVQGPHGNLYGTTSEGGVGENNSGTVFEISPAGDLTTLYRFCSQTNCRDGASPFAGLIEATDGSFYGTTTSGGTKKQGTIFKITAEGRLTTVYSFCSQTDCSDGSDALGGLLQGTNGTFYGTTSGGGTGGDGTVFSLALGLGPFIEMRPTSGKAGAEITVLGTDLTGTTGVSFNGTAAKFNSVSKSELKTTVPVGATTGNVQVTTPEKTLKSNVVFRVEP